MSMIQIILVFIHELMLQLFLKYLSNIIKEKASIGGFFYCNRRSKADFKRLAPFLDMIDSG